MITMRDGLHITIPAAGHRDLMPEEDAGDVAGAKEPDIRPGSYTKLGEPKLV